MQKRGRSISMYRARFKPICAINLCSPFTDHRLLITDYRLPTPFSRERRDGDCGFWRFNTHNSGDVLSSLQAGELIGSGGCRTATAPDPYCNSRDAFGTGAVFNAESTNWSKS